MSRDVALRHEFTEFIPEQLAPDTLYISIRFATASHLCLCGCGNKVVTPIRPTDWKLFFDGKTVSLDPSIGNWSFPCESHYWIRNNRIRWAPKWSRERIESGREYDQHAKEKYFAAEPAEATPSKAAPAPVAAPPKRGVWNTVKGWFS